MTISTSTPSDIPSKPRKRDDVVAVPSAGLSATPSGTDFACFDVDSQAFRSARPRRRSTSDGHVVPKKSYQRATHWQNKRSGALDVGDRVGRELALRSCAQEGVVLHFGVLLSKTVGGL